MWPGAKQPIRFDNHILTSPKQRSRLGPFRALLTITLFCAIDNSMPLDELFPRLKDCKIVHILAGVHWAKCHSRKGSRTSAGSKRKEKKWTVLHSPRVFSLAIDEQRGMVSSQKVEYKASGLTAERFQCWNNVRKTNVNTRKKILHFRYLTFLSCQRQITKQFLTEREHIHLNGS